MIDDTNLFAIIVGVGERRDGRWHFFVGFARRYRARVGVDHRRRGWRHLGEFAWFNGWRRWSLHAVGHWWHARTVVVGRLLWHWRRCADLRFVVVTIWLLRYYRRRTNIASTQPHR